MNLERKVAAQDSSRRSNDLTNQVLILAMHRFPHGDSSSNRLLAVAKTLRLAGFEPFVVGNGEAITTGGPDFIGVVDGISYTSVRRPGSGRIARILRYLLRSWVLSHHVGRLGMARARTLYGTQTTITVGLALMCRFVWRRPLIIDCTEWHEPFQFRLGRLSPNYWSFASRLRLLCRNANVVVVSGWMGSQLAARGCHVLRLPPQVDVDEFRTHAYLDRVDRLELLYAGTPGAKDDLASVLAGLLCLSSTERQRVHLTLAGVTDQSLRSFAPAGSQTLGQLEGVVSAVGVLTRDKVLDYLARSQFSILLRPYSRYSAAGFPSKIPESLAAGTPVIVNLTSDLGHYLTNDKDSIIAADCSPVAFAAAVRRALTLSATDLNSMSAAARNTARERFDYRVWAGPLRTFVDAVSGGHRRNSRATSVSS
jgi:glycosyltransferase involved in cell wall biosynthesis